MNVKNYRIPTNRQDPIDLKPQPTTDEAIASAIAEVIYMARHRGQSLSELMAEILADDRLLDRRERTSLSQIVARAWDSDGAVAQ